MINVPSSSSSSYWWNPLSLEEGRLYVTMPTIDSSRGVTIQLCRLHSIEGKRIYVAMSMTSNRKGDNYAIMSITWLLERWARDRKVVGSGPRMNGGRIVFSRVSFLCRLLFWYSFHPRVTAVARKRPRSFSQKCRWQVTAKHACTLRMWLCMKWHSAWLYGVHRTRRDGSSFMWHQPSMPAL